MKEKAKAFKGPQYAAFNAFAYFQCVLKKPAHPESPEHLPGRFLVVHIFVNFIINSSGGKAKLSMASSIIYFHQGRRICPGEPC